MAYIGASSHLTLLRRQHAEVSMQVSAVGPMSAVVSHSRQHSAGGAPHLDRAAAAHGRACVALVLVVALLVDGLVVVAPLVRDAGFVCVHIHQAVPACQGHRNALLPVMCPGCLVLQAGGAPLRSYDNARSWTTGMVGKLQAHRRGRSPRRRSQPRAALTGTRTARRRLGGCSCGPPERWSRPWPSSCRSTAGVKVAQHTHKVERGLVTQSTRGEALQLAATHLRDVLVARGRQEVGAVDVAPAVGRAVSTTMLVCTIALCSLAHMSDSMLAHDSERCAPHQSQDSASCFAPSRVCGCGVSLYNHNHCSVFAAYAGGQ